MNFINKKHVVRFEIRQNGRQVTGPLKHRPGGLAHVDVHFIGDNVSKRCLSKPWRPEYQDMIERFAAPGGSSDENVHLLFDARLPDIVFQPLRTNRPIERLLLFPRGGTG
jgi:hypothetical protein